MIIPIGLTGCNTVTTIEHNIQKDANKFNQKVKRKPFALVLGYTYLTKGIKYDKIE